MREQAITSEELAVLLIEDDAADAEYLQEVLRDQKDQRITIDWAKDLEEAQALTSQRNFGLILLDLFLARSTGFDTFHLTQSFFPAVPIVVLTGLDDRELAARAVREGAQDYLVKGGLEGSTLVKTLRYAVERSGFRRQLESSRQSFLNLLSDNTDGILVIDRDQHVAYANPAAASLFKRSVASLVGEPFGLPLSSSTSTEVDLVRPDNEPVLVEMRTSKTDWHGIGATLVMLHDITERKEAEREREKLITELREALAQVKKLSGLLPICSNCKKIRDDQGYWQALDTYVHDHSEAQVSHSICPDCLTKLYPDLYPEKR